MPCKITFGNVKELGRFVEDLLTKDQRPRSLLAGTKKVSELIFNGEAIVEGWILKRSEGDSSESVDAQNSR